MDALKDLLFTDYLIFLIFFVVGLLEFITIFIIVQVRRSKMRRWTLTKATVVDVIARLGSKGTVYCPVFQFKTINGGQVTHQSKFGSKPKYYQKGMEVDLYYNPENPKKYVVKGDKRIRFIFTVVTLCATIFLIIGLAGLLQMLHTLLKIKGVISG